MLNTNILPINYLHYGDALSNLSSIINLIPDYSSKEKVIHSLSLQNLVSKYSIDVISSYCNEYKDDICINTFKNDIIKSIYYNNTFTLMGCRGFSYKITDEYDFSYPLSPSINFKLALMSQKYLYYPPRLRRYLPRKHKNHIRDDKYPSIAFSLGKIENNNLFIFVLQSDLSFVGPASVREYIRGWRIILFAEIISIVKGKIENIYLCSAKDILSACHPEYKKPLEMPKIWYDIYDKTAEYYKMQLIHLNKKVNIQTLHDLPAKYIENMYYLKLN